MQISLCLIVKNEADNIKQCLENLIHVVQQIIIVDTGSTDNTVELAQSYGAEIYNYEWNDDFSAAKNFALDYANGDWIIFLDADEYFSNETVANIPKLIQLYGSSCDGFLTQMANIDVDRNNMILDEFFTTRIFRNDKNMRYVGRIHEQINNLSGRKNAWYKIEPNKIKLYHTGYSTHVIQQKCARNLKLLQEEFNENQENIDLYRYFADVYYGLGKYDQAIEFAQKDIDTGRKEMSYASRSYRVLLNSLRIQKKDFSIIEKALQKAMRDFPELPDFYAEYGLLLFTNNSYDQALLGIEKAILLFENYQGIETSSLGVNINYVYDVLGRIYEYKHQYKAAIDLYQKILKKDKYNQSVFERLYRLIYKEDSVYCIAFLNSLYDKQNEEDLTFLIQKMQKIQRNKILAYYLQAMNHLLKLDIVDVLALECVGSYERGRQSLLKDITGDLFDAACSAILLNDYSKIKDTIEFFSGSYKKIILRFYGEVCNLITTKDFEIYQKILLFILQADENKILKTYCSFVVDFELIQQFAIATLLKDSYAFSEAQRVYEHILSFDILQGKKNMLYDLAYCYYKLQDYQQAIYYFTQAHQLDKTDKKIESLLNWSKQKLIQIERVEEK